MEIRPEKGLGHFILGDSIFEIVKHIVSEKFGKCITRYNEEDPVTMHIILDLENLGIQLFFNPKTQLLEQIKVYDLTKCQLSYKKNPIVGPWVLSLSDICNTFGPTLAGHYCDEKSKYIIQYPGFTFVFLVDAKEVINNQPPDPTITFLNCFFIFKPDIKKENEAKRHIVVRPGEGIEINDTLLSFGDSPQRLISLLGKPEGVSKRSNRNIYRTADDDEYEFDYFYTYFSIGIDFLFDAETHRIIKFILHTNFPSCSYFNLYSKCQYRIQCDAEVDVFDQDVESFITPDMKWDKIQNIYGKCTLQPLVSNATNTPATQTNLYPYKSLIFEVMSNQYVSSVTMISC